MAPPSADMDWSAPLALPLAPHSPQGATYLLPHVTPDGNVYTTLTNFNPSKGFCCTSIFVDESTNGGKSWSVIGTPVPSATPPPLIYPNTTFRDGIEDTFTVGNQLDAQGDYPLYVAYEDFSAGVDNVLLTASFNGGSSWSAPIQVNDNVSPVDEFQPNLTTASDGTISVAFYDRRLACPAQGTSEAAGSGIALDQAAQNPGYTGPVPPYGATNYCVNASIQFYSASLAPIGHNIRLTQHTWDPQLNAAHPGSAGGEETFIGDYYGNTTVGTTDVTTFVSTFDDGSNPEHRQQQVVAQLAIPRTVDSPGEERLLPGPLGPDRLVETGGPHRAEEELEQEHGVGDGCRHLPRRARSALRWPPRQGGRPGRLLPPRVADAGQ